MLKVLKAKELQEFSQKSIKIKQFSLCNNNGNMTSKI